VSGLLTLVQTALVFGSLACWLMGRLGTLERGSEYFWGLSALLDLCLSVNFAIEGVWWAAGLFTFFAAACAWNWWDEHRKNRGKRRAVDALGAKSKALRDAIVRKAREVARPRPVLRPVPVPR
jgi:Na+-driven multidrug efflux pump